MEANPEVLTEYGRELGMRGDCQFVDLVSLEKGVLTAVYGENFAEVVGAILVVAPVDFLDNAARQLITYSEPCVFIKQTIDNACGAIAILHALSNNQGILEPSSIVRSMNIFTHDPIARGSWVEYNERLALVHAKYSRLGDTVTPNVEQDTGTKIMVCSPV